MSDGKERLLERQKYRNRREQGRAKQSQREQSELTDQKARQFENKRDPPTAPTKSQDWTGHSVAFSV